MGIKKNKIHLDKYYTPYNTMKYCVDKTLEIIDNIAEIDFIEPSAGQGVFSTYLSEIGYDVIALDIAPEGDNIIQTDYLKYPLKYKKNRCVIGNPPYGNRNNLSLQFYKKSVQIADYISFILPISQLNNNTRMYEFDLIHSENLGKVLFSDKIEVPCCLNIYKRPKENTLNKKPKYHLEDVEIIESRRGSKLYLDKCDLRICSFGESGVISEYPNQFAKETCFIIKNTELRNKILKCLMNADWDTIYPKTTRANNLTKWQIVKYLKENIPNIQ